VSHSLIKAAISCKIIWISVSVFWLVQSRWLSCRLLVYQRFAVALGEWCYLCMLRRLPSSLAERLCCAFPYSLSFLIGFLWFLNSASLEASGRRFEYMYYPSLMALNRCRGMVARPDAGNTRSSEAYSVRSDCDVPASCPWGCGNCDVPVPLGCLGYFS